MVKKELVFIVLGETLWQSILSDLVTLSSLVFCMFLSVKMDSTFWTVFSAILFLILMLSRALKHQSNFKRFPNVVELAYWAKDEAQSEAKNDCK
jgi:glycerol-3-phosphate acyltransferase PlsY